jgi:hypothetical protein
VFVDVVAVLIVPVTVVQVVDVVFVLDRLTAVPFGVRITVAGVDLAFGVPFAAVDMIHVVLVRNGLASVVRQVLMVQLLGVCGHENSFGCWNSQHPPAVLATARRLLWHQDCCARRACCRPLTRSRLVWGSGPHATIDPRGLHEREEWATVAGCREVEACGGGQFWELVDRVGYQISAELGAALLIHHAAAASVSVLDVARWLVTTRQLP